MNQEKIGKFIAQLRKEKKLTQEDLAKKLGVSNKTISRWETGKYMPDLSMFPILSKELNVNINDIMSGEIVDKKDYQETFEKNVVNTISKLDSKRKIWSTFLIIITLILLSIILWLFCKLWPFKIQYDSENMNFFKQVNLVQNVDNNEVTQNEYIILKTTNLGAIDEDYVTKVYTDENDEEIGVIFITATQTISNYFNKYNFGNCSSSIEIKSDFPKNYKVYYTNVSLKKIRNATNQELEEIIINSTLLFEPIE